MENYKVLDENFGQGMSVNIVIYVILNINRH